MSCRTETTTINDHEYSVTQWSAEKAILMKLKLAKVFGSSITKMAALFDGVNKNEDTRMEAEALSEGLQVLFEGNSAEEILSLIKSCVVGVARDGTKITDLTFNSVFSTDSLADVYLVFIFVLRVNYANFLNGQFLGKVLTKANLSL